MAELAATTNASKRVTVNLRGPDVEHLEEAARLGQLSQNDVIRKAIATEVFVQRALADGSKILVRHRNGDINEVTFV